MKIYFIADTHFNHKNILEYCNRPFADVEEMNKILVNNWNDTVKHDDIVYMLGDFCMGNKQEIKKFTEKLNGRKFLVMGNHDRYNMRAYMELGFEKAYDKSVLFDNFIILSHAPLFLPETMPYANIFGHVHNDEKFAGITKNSFCVSVERIEYKPISDDEIKKRIAQYSKKVEER